MNWPHADKVHWYFLFITTLPIMCLCFRASCAFCYYGVVLMTTELFEAPEGSLCTLSGTDESYTCTANCRPLSSQDYLDLLWTTLAEFPGEWVCEDCHSFLIYQRPFKTYLFYNFSKNSSSSLSLQRHNCLQEVGREQWGLCLAGCLGWSPQKKLLKFEIF